MLAVPGQLFTVGVTVTVDVTAAIPVFMALKAGMFPIPEAPKPIVVSLLVQVKLPPAGVLAKAVVGTESLLHTTIADGTVTDGTGFTVIV